MKILLIALVLFVFAIGIRLWNLNLAGQWSDETALLEKGYSLIELIKQGDLTNRYWYIEGAGHPMLTSYFYGLASYFDFIRYDANATSFLSAWKGAPIFNYDVTYSRLVSVLVSSISVILIFFIGVRYFSLFTGIVAAIILAMIPHFVGFSQHVTYESWVLTFFTACAFSYFVYLEKKKMYLLLLTGVLTGLTVGIKESAGIIIFLYISVYFVWRFIGKGKNISLWHLLILYGTAFLTYFVIWPQPWIFFSEYYRYLDSLWLTKAGLIPERIFGIPMGARFFYYIIAVLITTPVVLLLFTGVGIKTVYENRKKWIYVAVLVWFLIPFIMMFYHHRQHMVRYIIEIYAPLALLSAIGLETLTKYFTKNMLLKYSTIIPLFLYMLTILADITPYYLAYYNELVGGTKNVYEKKLFLIGWFGEGLRQPGIYVANDAKPGAKVGVATNPFALSAVYKIPTLQYEQFDESKEYDYVIVNYYHVIRGNFNESILSKDYDLVYTEKAGSIDYVHVYKRKTI